LPTWSHSRLSSFEKCPLQYRYRYVDRIRRDSFGVEAFMGQRVHEGLEHLYRRKGAGKTPRLDEVLGVFRRRWQEEFSPRVKVVRKGQVAEDYRAEGEKCLRGYYHKNAPFDDGETLAIEDKVEFSLDASGRYRILGYIDRVSRQAPGVYEIHDYKTAANIPGDDELRRDRQLTFYQMAVRDRHADAREVRLVWHFLQQGERRVSTRTEAEIEAHRRQAVRLIDTIEAAKEFPARTSMLCLWCEYRDICPAQKDRVAAEAAAVERALAAAREKRLLTAGRPIGAVEQKSLGLIGIPEPLPVARRRRGSRPTPPPPAVPPRPAT
jgi:putative RecB family exonuclease